MIFIFLPVSDFNSLPAMCRNAVVNASTSTLSRLENVTLSGVDYYMIEAEKEDAFKTPLRLYEFLDADDVKKTLISKVYTPTNVEKIYDKNGHLISSPTWEYTDGLDGTWKSSLLTVTAGVLNIYDELITENIMLRAGWYQVFQDVDAPKVKEGDYLEFSVIDKDDVLGLFSAYGLTVGVDILELKKFVITDYIDPYRNDLVSFESRAAFEVLAGLYFRKYIWSGGLVDYVVKIRTLNYEN